MEDKSFDILKEIKSKYKFLSKSQKLLADYILTNFDKAAYMTGAILGESSGVSEPTVVRFAHELGYEGFPQFKKALQNAVKVKLTTTQRIEIFSDFESGSILRKVIQEDMENLKHTIDEISSDNFQRAVDIITNAERVYIAGFRTSSLLSNYLGYYLDMILKNVTVLEHGFGDVYEKLVKFGPGDVLIGISFPRYSSKSADVASYAKEKGGNIIAITDNEKSPMADAGDVVLLAKSNIMAFVDTITAPLSLINGLIISVGYKNKDKTREVFRELENIWEKHDVFQNYEKGVSDE
ncbi:MurR/RpiR family transcriptional regulator [Alkalibacter mobilis]|uniref:MurR/RpiR family transcriptional regulator n=1 Tax=Alkalibacter mobilis TaxID=2787712 RepID=UPI00189E5AD3|nr:MurR/RpiR family transcriptional regulator [Alkalibacter mobilis]MBF7097630.1 MurR/RpiR family transcriptional regulator [Alkalibacter mobilis]